MSLKSPASRIESALRQVHRRARRLRTDRGYILITTMALMILLTATSITFFQTAHGAMLQTRASRAFVESGQYADQAIQEVMYSLNEKQRALTPASYPSAVAPETLTSGGRGYSWWVDAPTSGPAGFVTKLTSQGTADDAARGSSVNVFGVRVGTVKQDAAGAISYTLSPSSAWSHALIGNQVTAHNGTGVLPAAAITGAVGVLGTGLTLTQPADAVPVVPTAGTFLYGKTARAIPVNAALAPKAIVPSFALDAGLAGRQLDGCPTLVPWVASEHGGRIYADGDTGCYSSMTFDVATVVVGAGSFTAFVDGPVLFKANVTAPTSQLNIITGVAPTITFDVSATRDIEAFVYAPQADCITTNVAAGALLRFQGSLACDVINVTGQFKWLAPEADSLNTVIGSSTYNRTVWYLDAYTQPAGGR